MKAIVALNTEQTKTASLQTDLAGLLLGTEALKTKGSEMFSPPLNITFRQGKQISRRIVPELAAEARARQRQLQLIALASRGTLNTQLGDQWLLERHLVYCGDTKSDEFIDCLPFSNAALAIATPSPTWNHDYLINKARVVAVLRSKGYIHEFCSRHQMPFRFEIILGDLYVAIFSRQLIHKPQMPIEISGIEGIVAYLVGLYTTQGNFVIAPDLGYGEVLITCERMGRICFAGDQNPEVVSRAIARWQNWTRKQAAKTVWRS